MRLPRWMPWVEDVLRGSPSIAAVQTFEDAGITDPRFGHEITLHTGARIRIQWKRTSPPSGDLGEEEIVTGEPPARVTLPELPSAGRTQARDIERHLVALIANAAAEGNPEIKSVEQKSTQKDPGPRPCCVIVHMHNGADIFGAFRNMAPAGAGFSGGDHQQREEV